MMVIDAGVVLALSYIDAYMVAYQAVLLLWCSRGSIPGNHPTCRHTRKDQESPRRGAALLLIRGQAGAPFIFKGYSVPSQSDRGLPVLLRKLALNSIIRASR